MTAAGQPHREPLRTTMIRNALIAIGAGTVLAASARSIRWPFAVVLMLWPSFGGHWIEVWYLNWLRPRLPAAPSVQRLARIGTWFVGGCGLGLGMSLTARALGGNGPATRPAWWLAGVVFVGLELIVHVALQLRGKQSFFNGRS